MATCQRAAEMTAVVFDVGNVLIHPTEKNVQAVSFEYARQNWVKQLEEG